MFCVKVHETQGEVIVACCDQHLVGKTLSEGEHEVTVSEGFYGREIVNEEEILERIKEASIVNLLGDKIVDLLVDKKLIPESNIKRICGVKHAQLIAIQE